MDNDLELTVAQVIKKYGLLNHKKRSKSLGQHFLRDSSLLKKIAGYMLPLEDNDIVEIGPGPCGLTREIVKIAGNNNVFCIEKDIALKAAHDNFTANANCNVHFIYQDALRLRPQELTSKNVVIISNLPYNVGTRLLINWLLDLNGISKMILMFQKEVADRICAALGSKDYGRLSVISQLLCKTEKLFEVSKAAFYPPPKVTSTVVKLIPQNIVVNNIKNLEILTNNCFRHRRKTIYSILKRYYKTDMDKVLAEVGIDKCSRPENITPKKFLELSEILEHAEF
ncbi:MAG: 16S rRNA (adenine(1518)-N(6)/adenine(1519)-N(6))-dimethyltransferase RsmA [Holosporales bacterium]|jgi:16S rRNA (adenine1518-N6/adenine1519-N6)-dimethyltransferase|nr:16S rRNA (adenine(1518)-N(6)/adenine(1519)-N(6))-dimethyltransferase RsmA [Holosporales bacterium]